MSGSRVTWGTSVPILVFLGLSVLDLGPTNATDRRQTDVSQTASSLIAIELECPALAEVCALRVLLVTKFGGKVAHGPRKKASHFGGNPGHVTLGLRSGAVRITAR